MAKKLFCILIVCLLFLGGCWDYQSLNEMAIVAGMAIDKNEDGEYQVTFDLVDITQIKDKGPRSLLLEAKGKTLFDAARNAKKRIINELYFGHMETVVISGQVAREEDFSGIIDWFLRSIQPRETLCMMVSMHGTAKDILTAEGIGNNVNSIELHQMGKEDKKHTASTSYIELYKIFSILKAQGEELTLPAVHIVKNGKITTSELNGTAVFNKSRLVGLLSPEETKYFLFATGKVENAAIALPWGEGEQDTVSLEVHKHTSNTTFTYKDGNVKINIDMDTTVTLNETSVPFNSSDLPKIAAIEYTAQEKLKQSVKAVVKTVQDEYASDIYGFGSLIEKQDPALWRKLKDQWDTLFSKLEVEVNSKVYIKNTATLKDS